MKKIKYFFEYLLVLSFYHFFRFFSIDKASEIGGIIGKKLGPWLKVHVTARRNMQKCFPEFSEEKLDELMEKMWDNAGRYIGEFPHLNEISGDEFKKRVEFIGSENVEFMKNSGKGAILFSGHFANLEILPKTAYEYGTPLAIVYRPANNRMVNNFIMRVRKKSHAGMFEKGKAAARGVAGTLRNKGFAGMLVDQKMNDGIRLKFFGRDAMTAPAIAQFAMKYDALLLPAQVQRKRGAYFTVKVFPPIEIKREANSHEEYARIMQHINDIFEGWIREKPEEWFWLHKRWVD